MKSLIKNQESDIDSLTTHKNNLYLNGKKMKKQNLRNTLNQILKNKNEEAIKVLIKYLKKNPSLMIKYLTPIDVVLLKDLDCIKTYIKLSEKTTDTTILHDSILYYETPEGVVNFYKHSKFYDETMFDNYLIKTDNLDLMYDYLKKVKVKNIDKFVNKIIEICKNNEDLKTLTKFCSIKQINPLLLERAALEIHKNNPIITNAKHLLYFSINVSENKSLYSEIFLELRSIEEIILQALFVDNELLNHLNKKESIEIFVIKNKDRISKENYRYIMDRLTILEAEELIKSESKIKTKELSKIKSLAL